MQNLQLGSENFDLWLKLASDNKINSRNSWDVALIDYFYDLSILREGDQINFQKASATLDGCVKIYTSRIDSAATETGKLLSGLTSNKEREDEERANHEASVDPKNQDSSKLSKQRNAASYNNDTLIEFNKIRYKKLDSELTIDPVFRKALSDFDEGGSKSLLFNILKVNEEERIVFDATTGSKSKTHQENDEIITESQEHAETVIDSIWDTDGDVLMSPRDDLEPKTNSTIYIDENIKSLGNYFMQQIDFNNDKLSVCPSLPVIEDMLNNLDIEANDLFGKIVENTDPNKSLDYDALHNEISMHQPDASMNIEPGSFFDFGYDNGIDIDADDDNAEEDEEIDSLYHIGNKSIRNLFGEPSFAAADILGPVGTIEDDDQSKDESSTVAAETLVDNKLIAFFDEGLKRNWRGPDNWKVLNYKKRLKVDAPKAGDANSLKPKLKKNEFQIDFLGALNENLSADDEFEEKYFPDVADLKSHNSTNTLPKSQWVSKDHNLLPDDKNFNTRRFITLFDKNEYINSVFLKKYKKRVAPNSHNDNGNNILPQDEDLDAGDNFWANDNFDNGDFDSNNILLGHDNVNENGSNGFFSHVPDLHPPSDVAASPGLEPAFGSTRSPFGGSPRKFGTGNNSNGLTIAKRAKKVDIKLLKDNLWESIKLQQIAYGLRDDKNMHDTNQPDNAVENNNGDIIEKEKQEQEQLLSHSKLHTKTLPLKGLKFSEVIQVTNDKYDLEEGAANDISCSYYFICLLHLANEKNLLIEQENEFEDLTIKNTQL